MYTVIPRTGSQFTPGVHWTCTRHVQYTLHVQKTYAESPLSALHGEQCIWTYVVSALIFETYHVKHYLETVIVYTIKVLAPPKLWNGVTGGSWLKLPPPAMHSISMSARKRMILTVLTVQSASQHLWLSSARVPLTLRTKLSCKNQGAHHLFLYKLRNHHITLN